MIYRVSVGDVTVLLDDEMTDERPTPEVSRDYLRACCDQAAQLYAASIGADIISGTTDDED